MFGIICGESWFNESTKMFSVESWKQGMTSCLLAKLRGKHGLLEGHYSEAVSRCCGARSTVKWRDAWKVSAKVCKQCFGHVCLQHKLSTCHPSNMVRRITRNPETGESFFVRCFNFHPWKRSGDDVGGCRVDLYDGVETNTHRLKLTLNQWQRWMLRCDG